MQYSLLGCVLQFFDPENISIIHMYSLLSMQQSAEQNVCQPNHVRPIQIDLPIPFVHIGTQRQECELQIAQ